MTHFGYLLRILHCRTSQAVTHALADNELTSAQGHIMGYLAHCQEPPCPKDVEEHFHLSHPTVSGLLSRMEKKEFIALRPDPKDRRCKRIYMLPRGAQCNDIIYRAICDNEEQLAEGFSEEEKALFADLLTRAARNMGGDLSFLIPKEELDP